MTTAEYEVGQRVEQAKGIIRAAHPGELGNRLIRELGGSSMDDFDIVPYQLNQLVQQGIDPIPVLRRVDVEWTIVEYKNQPGRLGRHVARQLGYQKPEDLD
jgi:hypothetical protein